MSHLRTHVFGDGDEAMAAMTGASLELSLRGPTTGDWKLTEVRLGGAMLTLGETGASMAALGGTDPGLHSFVFPLRAAGRWTVNRITLGPRRIFSFGPGAEFAETIDDPTSWVMFQADPDLFGQAHGGVAGITVPDETMTRLHSRVAEAMRTLIRCHEPGLPPPLQDELRESLLEALNLCLPCNRFEPPAAYGAYATRLRECLRSHPEVALTVRDMCTHLSLSERSLRRLFRASFRMGPARYLRIRRLHRSRQALRSRKNPPESVTSVCMAFGFFDQGRFAREYQALFGELPSQTLRNARGQNW